DLTVSVPKLFFGYATGTNLLFPFAVGGATALFQERSTPEKLFEVIERYHPTILTTVPTMINAMLNMEGSAERDIKSLRFCYSAGEALPVELYHRWMETFGIDRKSTRLNSSHLGISYAVFCLKKKMKR